METSGSLNFVSSDHVSVQIKVNSTSGHPSVLISMTSVVVCTGYCCPTTLNLCPLPSPQGGDSTDFMKQHPFWYQKGKLKVLLLLLLAVGIW